MIIYDLHCDREHRFEGWFKNSADFGDQLAGGMLACPVCGSAAVRKVPSASHIGGRHGERGSGETGQLAIDSREVLSRLHAFVERHYEDVGSAFPEEAKRIHYGETSERPIRGRASGDEVRELHEEGVAVVPLPPKPEDKDKLN